MRRTVKTSQRAGPFEKFYDYRAIPESTNAKGLWIEPVPELLTTEIRSFAATSSVEPVRIPGYWLDKVGQDIPIGAAPLPNEKVIYALHGGGYIAYSAHPDDPTASIAKGLLEYCKPVLRTFSIDYRLSVGAPFTPRNPFPAALFDALAGYNYLVNTVGFSPSNIIVEGDSAGGNLALALTRYLVENQENTQGIKLPPPPGSLLLLSPWCDLGQSHNIPGSAAYTCVKTDYLSRPGSNLYSTIAFTGAHGLVSTENNRYISPASRSPSMETVSFKGFPRTFMIAGGAEVLLDSIRTLRDKMVKDLGAGEEGVVYYEAEDAIHDYIGLPFHEPERSETLVAIDKWI